jgi:hypothetical protein
MTAWVAASACSPLASAILRHRHLSSSPVDYQHFDLRETRGEPAGVEELKKRPHVSDALAPACYPDRSSDKAVIRSTRHVIGLLGMKTGELPYRHQDWHETAT